MAQLTWKVDSPLPPQNTPFEFKGAVYQWKECPCDNPKCKRPFATVGAAFSLYMTTLLRGNDQGGMLAEDVMVKFMGVEVYAKKLDEGQTPPELWAEFIEEIAPQGQLNTGTLSANGVDPEEVELALMEIESESDGITILPFNFDDLLGGSGNINLN